MGSLADPPAFESSKEDEDCHCTTLFEDHPEGEGVNGPSINSGCEGRERRAPLTEIHLSPRLNLIQLLKLGQKRYCQNLKSLKGWATQGWKCACLCEGLLLVQLAPWPASPVVQVEHGDPYLHGNLWRFYTNFGGCSSVNTLSVFDEANAMGIELYGDDQLMMYLSTTMTASRSSKKSTYATWLKGFDERDGRRYDFVVKAFLSYCYPDICWQTGPRTN